MTVRQISTASSAYRNLSVNYTSAVKSMRNLSSGYRINSAADDAAGLAISEKMRGQIGGLTKAGENVQQGINLLQTAEGGLSNASSVINRMQELAVQASNGTYTDSDRALLNEEFSQLKDQLGQLASSTNYNGMKLLDGSFDTLFQVGADGSADQQVGVAINDMSVLGLNLQDIDISTWQGANDAIGALSDARNLVSSERASIAATQNRLEYTLSNIGVTKENLVQSESTIRDADIAKEMINYTTRMMQTQASQAMQAQSMNLTRQYMLGILMMR